MRKAGERGQGEVVVVWIIGILLAVVLQIVLGGLWRTEVTYTPVLTERIVGEVPFEETFTARHWLGGLIKGEQPDLKPRLSKYLRDKERVTELTVRVRHSFVDNLLTIVTLVIYTPVTVDVKGKIGRVGEAAATLPVPETNAVAHLSR